MQKDKEKFKSEFKARIYGWALRIIKFIDRLPRDWSCRVIGQQLLRSGTSIGANYIEAQAASSKKDFVNYLQHALKSANESKFWIAILRDAQKANQIECNELLKELEEISKILGSSILTAKGRKNLNF